MSIDRTRCLTAVLVASTLSLGTPRRAHADPGPSEGDLAQGRELLQEGVDLRTSGDSLAALERLKAAHALVRTPITGLELGKTYLALGKLVEAREVFLSVARITVRVEETERSKAARAESDTLSNALITRIPKLRIKVTGVPAESVGVTVDGAAVPTEALAAPRFVNPGSHMVVARSSTGAVTEAKVELKEGETRDLELKLVLTGAQESEPAVGVAAPSLATHLAAATKAEPQPRSHALEWSLLGGGAAVGIAGGVLMGVAAAQSKNANDEHNLGSSDSAKTLWTAGLVGAFVGGAAFVSGGVVFLAQPHGPPQAARSGCSVWLTGSANRVAIEGAW